MRKKKSVVKGQPKPSENSKLSVEDRIRQLIAYNISKTRVPIRFNEIKSFEEVQRNVYKVTLDDKYKNVQKLTKAMKIEYVVYTGAELNYVGDEIIMVEGQEDYVTPPVYGFSTIMQGKSKAVPSAFIMYENGKEAEKVDKMCALSHDSAIYGR